MPYYYLISEVPDSIEDFIYDARTYKKPETYNLLLPSIHASRDDNILNTESDAELAVKNLLASCKDSASWPSTEYCILADGNDSNNCSNDQIPPSFDPAPEAQLKKNEQPFEQGPMPVPENLQQSQAPAIAKYKPPFWAYDSIRPDLLEAARALFYERKRQEALFAGVPSWSYPSGAPRLPTDYELFAAWASMPRSDKLSYVSEVSGSHSSSQMPTDTLSTQRAVTSLLAACPDSCSWPSFQFSRLQAQQRPHLPPPTHHPYHFHHRQLPVQRNPLHFKLD